MGEVGAGPGAERVLVLRALGLGDLLAGLPALRALRARLPGAEVVLAAPEVLRPLVEAAQVVDHLLPTAELAPVRWRRQRPDLAVDLHGNGPPTKAILAATAPRRLLAFEGPSLGGRWVPGPAWRAAEHERARWVRLVAEGLGPRPDGRPDDVEGPDALGLPGLGPVARASARAGAVPLAVVHPGAASGSRRWPPERFAEVARRLAAAGLDVVVTGSPGERDLAAAVARLAGLPAAAVLAGTTDLLGLARLVASADLVVCGDTGLAHVASATGTPSVVLCGPVSPARWGPPSGPHVALWHGDEARPGDPHGTALDPALAAIDVEEVWRAVLAATGRVNLPRPRAPLSPPRRR